MVFLVSNDAKHTVLLWDGSLVTPNWEKSCGLKSKDLSQFLYA